MTQNPLKPYVHVLTAILIHVILHSLPSNYRPISLTCISCKVMESIVSQSIISHLRSHQLISADQFGFLSRRSTCTQLLTTLNDWTISIDNHLKVDAVYIDFAKLLILFVILN